jgi:hypothetical protein
MRESSSKTVGFRLAKRGRRPVKKDVAVVEDEFEDDVSSVYLSQEAGSTRAGKSSSKYNGGSSQGGKNGKKSNTVVQQIRDFSLTPMNDKIAADTLEDHKYLLLEV